MGDSRRFDALAEYVSNYYRSGQRIADVAGGKCGRLNERLTKNGNIVTTIDPVFDVNSSVYGIKDFYHERMASGYDLIVGLHPDEATESIVYSAKFKPIVIVPCCKHWEGREMKARRHSIESTIRKYFEFLDIPYSEEKLDISGANKVFRTF